ncbi:uncharacterized protein LOC106151893 [Lingula anatina]|uniref:Uncharacterized protein LOC106151893 n=1 Tax=Lingula anatina TaxID=7574 RepID=A0A1S3H3S0_LINAN|nr:uncharacterized protein LOC106151893 [Lingula anatina]|eukprot:XP_013380785.1 uncharacterized protein LOC106151893 [Lingula anatina]
MTDSTGNINVGLVIGVSVSGAVITGVVATLIIVCCCCRKRGYTFLRRLTSGRQVMVIDRDEECANRIDILPHMKIADIKTELSGSETLEVEKMRLLYHHDELGNDENVDIALSRRRAKTAKITLQKLIKLTIDATPDRTCELYVSPQHDTVGSAAEIVASSLRINQEHVKFEKPDNGGDILESDSTFETCGIKSDTRLKLMPITTTAKVFSREGKFQEEIWKCSPLSTVTHLFESIQNTVDPDKQALDIRRARRRYFSSPQKCEQDSMTVHVPANDTWVNADEIAQDEIHTHAQGVFIIEELITVSVEFPGGKIMSCKVYPCDRIKDLRENISKRKNIPVKYLELLLNAGDAECLDDTRFIFNCNRDKLYVKPVIVDLLTDIGLIHQECDPTGTVKDLKEIMRRVEPRAILNTTHFIVKEFVSTEDLKERPQHEEHEENTPLCLVRKVHISHNKKIHVIFPSGRDEIINCHLTMTVGQFRQTLHEKTRCPLHHLQLSTSDDQPMRDEDLVSDYKLLDEDKIKVAAIPVWVTIDDERIEFQRDALLSVETTADDICAQRDAVVGCLEYFHEKQNLWRAADDNVRSLPLHCFRELKIRTLKTPLSEST